MKLNNLQNHVIIHCDTEAKAKKLLKYLQNQGYTWSSGRTLDTTTNWKDHKENTAYSIYPSTADVLFTSRGYYIDNGEKVLEFKDSMINMKFKL